MLCPFSLMYKNENSNLEIIKTNEISFKDTTPAVHLRKKSRLF
jgi:hypothetical protein